ncbi:protein of unknown function DUF1597 [Pirellula staleyi DSM 6068]|uniref:Porin n=1 Tax=Pirellula staleyi (strain ATCC 27377 / DSM 6068 / ICPB 4128) TaxID=530564 RepID=D2R648_PIRSD|nr:porin [Pirellula staleyi]ADB19133.1 protein of unknown function DUF1597 [Pirellula staleyi DSM 6068]
MKLSKLAFAAAVAWSIYAANAQAQTPGTAVQPVTYANDYYYYQPEATSPSDMAPPAAAVAPAPCAACEEAAEEEECEPWRLFCQKECGWNIYGHASGGVMANGRPAADNFNGVTTFADQDQGQFNQLYVTLENTIDTGGCGWDIGGRVDFLYGSDFFFTTAQGLETDPTTFAPQWSNATDEYGLAMPQAYMEVGYNDLSVKLGHFYTNIGYEVVPATGNFFYTHAYTMQYGEPFTHTGALATYKYSDSTSIVGGVVNGWDAFDRPIDTAAGLFGFTWTNGCDLTIAYGAIVSPDEPNLNGGISNRNMQSIVVTYNVSDSLTYVFQSDQGYQLDGANPGLSNAGASAEWYGVNQYLFYTINDCWKAGMRFEWFRDDDGARVTGLRQGNTVAGQGFAGDFMAVSAGLNWTPTANLTIRPEVRYDWTDLDETTGLLPFNAGTDSYQFLYGFDAIYIF